MFWRFSFPQTCHDFSLHKTPFERSSPCLLLSSVKILDLPLLPHNIFLNITSLFSVHFFCLINFYCIYHYLVLNLATQCSVLAWRIPGMAEPGRLPSLGLHRVGHDWSDLAAAAAILNLEKEMATHCSVLAWRIPGMGEPGGLPSVGLHRVGSDLAAAAV